MATDEKITLYFSSDNINAARETAEKMGADTVQKFGVKVINAFVSYFDWAHENGMTMKNSLGEEVLRDRADREEELINAIRLLAAEKDGGEPVNTAWLFASLNLPMEEPKKPAKKSRGRR